MESVSTAATESRIARVSFRFKLSTTFLLLDESVRVRLFISFGAIEGFVFTIVSAGAALLLSVWANRFKASEDRNNMKTSFFSRLY